MMKKIKYKYNPDTLSYEKVEYSGRQKFKKILSYTVAILLSGMVLNITLSLFFDSPKEKALKREISQLVLQYEVMNERFEVVNRVLYDVGKRDDNIYRVVFGAEPISNSVREAGFGGVNRYSELEGMTNSDIVVETAKKLDKIKKKLYVQSKSYDEVIELAKNKELLLSSVPAIQPISNKDLRRTASGWGYRIHPIYKVRKFHWGMDFTAPKGTDVYSTGDGTICFAGTQRGYGNTIEIDHGYGYKTLYAHLNGFNVKKGQKVKRGDIIAFVGNTGQSVGPHLHYEVSSNNKKVNPMNYYFNDLSADEYDEMIVISAHSGQTFD